MVENLNIPAASQLLQNSTEACSNEVYSVSNSLCYVATLRYLNCFHTRFRSLTIIICFGIIICGPCVNIPFVSCSVMSCSVRSFSKSCSVSLVQSGAPPVRLANGGTLLDCVGKSLDPGFPRLPVDENKHSPGLTHSSCSANPMD